MTTDWTIAPLLLATAVRDRSQVLLLAEVGEDVPGAVLAWLLQNGRDKVLVDTGPFGPSTPPEAHGIFHQTPEQTIEAQLARFDTVPAEISLVVHTHLHLDHCAGNAYFENARFLAQRREVEYARAPLPIHRRAYAVDLDGIDLALLDGDAEIAPGLRAILTPGHSPGSQAVVVQTAAGPYVIAGDTITHFRNMHGAEGRPFWPGPIYVDLRDYYDSLERLRTMGAVILPGHDPAVTLKDRYP